MKSSQIRSMQGGYDPTAFLVPLILLGLHAAVQNPKQFDSVSKKIKVSKSRKSSKMSGGGDLDMAQQYSLNKMAEMLGGFSELFDDASARESFQTMEQSPVADVENSQEAIDLFPLPTGGDAEMLPDASMDGGAGKKKAKKSKSKASGKK